MHASRRERTSEPALDPMQIISIRNLIKGLAREKTIIFSTHILQEASAVADHLMIIDRGKIIASGTVPELKKERAGEQTFFVAIQGEKDALESALKGLAAIKDVRFVEDVHHVVRFSCVTSSYEDAARSINQIVREKGLFLKELTPKDLSFEDVFLGLFKKAEQRP